MGRKMWLWLLFLMTITGLAGCGGKKQEKNAGGAAGGNI